MDELDRKLVKIVGTGMPMALAVADIVNDIKQAFIEAGWLAPDNAKKLLEMENHMANLANDLAQLPNIQYIKPNKAMTSAKNLMTGQEWYDRFMKILWHPPKQEAIKHNEDGESHDRFYRTGGELFMYDRATEAAKKAAVIE